MTDIVEQQPSTDLLDMTTEIVAAYVAHNSVTSSDLPGLIAEVHAALGALGNVPVSAPAEALKPAVSIKKSVTPEHLVCLEDGLTFKSLKRHLRVHHNLTAEQYREKWSLPADYPMVAPSYSATRSALAIENGLGRKPEDLTPAKPARKKLGLKFGASS